MSVTITGKLNDFFQGATKEFEIIFSKDGVTPNIVNDEVRIFVKTNKADTDANAKINVIADVITYGADGKAVFKLTPSETALIPGSYYYQIIWTESNGDVNVLPVNKIKILDSIFDIVES